MLRREIEAIIKRVKPKIKKHLGESAYQEKTPQIRLHRNIYARLSGIEGLTGETDPFAEYEWETNTIWIYWPKIKSERDLIESLLHEWTHYLQDPVEMKRIYDDGEIYTTHPFEVEAIASESDWKLFVTKNKQQYEKTT